ncbi:MAG: hypothetical protein ACI9MD_002437, partial [Psychrobacter glaciei]
LKESETGMLEVFGMTDIERLNFLYLIQI